jgi:MFS family permease
MLESQKVTMSKWVIYYIILANAIGMMSMDIHLPVLQEIKEELNTSFFMVQQLLIIFYVIGIIARIILGPLSDSYGRRKILLMALDIQILGQAIQVFAVNIEFLLLGRIVQALASGGLAILINAIILDVYSGNDRTKMLSISELIQPISIMVAPLIGGYLATYWGWRAGFVFLLINLIIARIILTSLFKETHFNLRKASIGNTASDYYRILRNSKFMSYNILLSAAVSSYMLYAVISSYIYIHIILYA